MQRPLLVHIETFIAERYSIGRDEKYVRELQKKLLVLAAEARWKYLTDITSTAAHMIDAGPRDGVALRVLQTANRGFDSSPRLFS